MNAVKALDEPVEGSRYSSYQKNNGGSSTSNTMSLIPGNSSAGDYSVSYWYDKNSNLLEAERQGWAYVDEDGNDVYDTVEDVMIEYNGNQRKSATLCTVTDDDYYGKMTFVNGVENSVEYAYDGNGNLTRDDNKGQTYEYDLLGHPSKVIGKTYTIEYVYAPDGRKLRAVHKTYTSTKKKTVKTSTTTDYVNGYIFTNGKPSMFCFDGGYYSFDTNGKLNGCHYYIQDYQGNNREVVNACTNAIEQINHYYSYGGLMGVISTKPNAQNFKYGGKELDLSNGLNLYDFEAWQYDAVGGPNFTSVDPLAEKYYGISPYAYCAGDPVNCVDKDGKCPLWVVTCTVGAIVGGAVGAVSAMADGKSGQEVLAAAGGVVAGAIAGTGAGLVTELGLGTVAGLGVSIGTNALGNGLGNAAEQIIGTGTVDTKEVGVSTIAGAATGLISFGAGKVVEKACPVTKSELTSKVATKSGELKQMQKSGMKMASKNGNKKLSNKDLKEKAEAMVNKEIKADQEMRTIFGTIDPAAYLINNTLKDELNKKH